MLVKFVSLQDLPYVLQKILNKTLKTWYLIILKNS